jgi:single-strand DNA-binding protein
MKASMNRVILMGNLTHDPNIRHLDSGSVVGVLSLAMSDSYRNKAGEVVDTTCYVDAEIWNKQATVCETYLKKGSAVLVEGRLRRDEWADKEGQKRSKLLVRADRVHFMDPPPRPAEAKKEVAEAIPA